MLRSILVPCGLVSVVMAMSLMVSSSEAQQPIETQTLLEQQIEALPEGPMCWDVRRGSLASGSAAPASGYHTHGWVAAYIFDGVEFLEYQDGRTSTIWSSRAALFQADTPHRHVSIGAAARTNVGFELTCEPQPNSIGNSGVLPGIWSGPAPYRVQVRERVWQLGAQTPVHVLSGPTTTLVLEGTIRSASESGVACFGPGQIYVSPVGELAQNTNVGSTPARTLDVDLWPAGEIRTVPQPPEVQLPIPVQVCPTPE